MQVKKIMVTTSSIIILCVVSVSFIPMGFVIKPQKAVNQNISFSSINGYWWRGTVANVHVSHRGYDIPLGDVQWRYDWASLLSVTPCMSLVTTSTQISNGATGRICYSLADRQLMLVDILYFVDAITVSQVFGVEVQGVFVADIQQISVQESYLTSVKADVIWKNAKWHNGEKWFALGELLFAINTNVNKAIEVNVMDIASAFAIEIATTVRNQQIESIKGYIEPYDAIDVSLAESLDWVANNKIGKRYYIDYDWRY